MEEALKQVGYERPLDNRLVLMLTPNLKNPIFAQQAERVENELNPYGLTSIICPVYPGTPRERDYVESLVDAGVAAIAFLSSSNTLRDEDHRVVQFVESRGIPYVSINGGFPESDAPVVSTDDWRAAELAVGHLHDLGHRKIGLLAGPTARRATDGPSRRQSAPSGGGAADGTACFPAAPSRPHRPGTRGHGCMGARVHGCMGTWGHDRAILIGSPGVDAGA
ncbi:substrate-binding domain-containing protein [Streptomyces sp. NPDC006875]|uniref:substrate-binding domain-containing protein n=1 Tax=Streptomyces sp. NPDC006875 TaxID=3154781 RepID=UPI0033E6C299